MVGFSDHNPYRHRGVRRPSDDLEILRAHPSLADIADRGSRLDRLPIRSAAWAFVGAVLVTVLFAGAASAVFVVVTTALALALAAGLVRAGETGAARATLRYTCLGLLAWVLLIVCSVQLPSMNGTSQPSPTTVTQPAGVRAGAPPAPFVYTAP